jgi:tetratricopeptide (TPR) repeat protein
MAAERRKNRDSKARKKLGASTTPEGVQAKLSSPVEKSPRISGREWVIRLGLIIVSPAVCVMLLEFLLRLVGYGYPTSFFVPRDAGADLITNQKFAWQYAGPKSPLRPALFRLPATKDPGTLRICVLGESAAMGTPDPAFGLSRMLEAQLRRAYPSQKFEMLNAAMRGINSYAIRKIAQECASKEVDVFVVYMGNNEVVGLHCPAPDLPAWAQSLTFIRAVEWVKTTKFGQLFSELVEGDVSREKQDMDYFRAHRFRTDDPRREKVLVNFQANLRDICDAATARGAKLLLSTVAVNLRDCPPLGSLHRADLSEAHLAEWNRAMELGIQSEGGGQWREAISRFETAAKIDDHYAELHFRMARCKEALKEPAEARRHYVLARDWDALQFRTDSSMNEIIRQEALARKDKRVVLVDVEKELSNQDAEEAGIPGRRLFYEHVHPTFEGNYLLASACFSKLAPVLNLRAESPGVVPIASRQDCAEFVGYTPYSDVNIFAAMVRLTAGPPFLDQLGHTTHQAEAQAQSKQRLASFNMEAALTSIAILQKAVAQDPEFWPTRYNLSLLLVELGRNGEATNQYRHLVDQFPEYSRFRLELGNVLLRMGDKPEALAELRRAQQLDPGDKELRQMVAQVSGK